MKYNKLTRTKIEELGWDTVSEITEVMLEEYTDIEDYAFSNCFYLKSVTLNDSITHVGDSVFDGCVQIKTPIFNQHVFAYLPMPLTEIEYEIPDGIEQIAGGAFYYCRNLTGITIPNSVRTIGKSAFQGCSKLTTVKISDNITYIGESAFEDCPNIETITLPNNATYTDNILDNVVYVDDKAFRGCSSLTAITIPESAVHLGQHVFESCTSMATISIGINVTEIGDFCFHNCTNLTNVTIPNSVTSIGHRAFENCTKLTSITLPTHLTYIGSYVFSNCTKLTNIIIGNETYRKYSIYENNGYKGFKSDMTCKDFQYQEGVSYSYNNDLIICQQGFHACLNLCDVFNYYSGLVGIDFVVHKVTLGGILNKKETSKIRQITDSKIVAKRITIGERITL